MRQLRLSGDGVPGKFAGGAQERRWRSAREVSGRRFGTTESSDARGGSMRTVSHEARERPAASRRPLASPPRTGHRSSGSMSIKEAPAADPHRHFAAVLPDPPLDCRRTKAAT